MPSSKFKFFSLGFGVLLSFFSHVANAVVGGVVVPKGTYPTVVQIKSGKECTAAYVGPKILLTSAQCISAKNPVVTFEEDGKTKKGIGVRSFFYTSRGHDLAVIVIIDDVKELMPLTVMKVMPYNIVSTVVGYGCPQFGFKEDGLLRMLYTRINLMTDLEYSIPGRVICRSDAGGPVLYQASDSKVGIIAVSSRSGAKYSSLFTRLNSPESLDFLTRITENYGVGICGINVNCPEDT